MQNKIIAIIAQNLGLKTIQVSKTIELGIRYYKKLKYSQNQLIPSIGSNPDDGFKIGIVDIYTVYGFERNPFSQQHTINASYFFANKGFDIAYNAEFANIFNNWNFLVETQFTSPNYSVNFYNFGNETLNFENDFNKNYHRVRISKYVINPFLKWKGRFGAEFKIGPSIESIEVEDTANRYINAINYQQEKNPNTHRHLSESIMILQLHTWFLFCYSYYSSTILHYLLTYT